MPAKTMISKFAKVIFAQVSQVSQKMPTPEKKKAAVEPAAVKKATPSKSDAAPASQRGGQVSQRGGQASQRGGQKVSSPPATLPPKSDAAPLSQRGGKGKDSKAKKKKKKKKKKASADELGAVEEEEEEEEAMADEPTGAEIASADAEAVAAEAEADAAEAVVAEVLGAAAAAVAAAKAAAVDPADKAATDEALGKRVAHLAVGMALKAAEAPVTAASPRVVRRVRVQVRLGRGWRVVEEDILLTGEEPPLPPPLPPPPPLQLGGSTAAHAASASTEHEAEVARALLRDFISKRRTEVETAAHRLTSWMGSLMHGHKTTTSDAEAAAAATKVQAAMRGKSIRSAREKKQPAQDEPAPKEVETAAHRLTSWMGSLMHGHKTTTSDAEAAAAATKVQAAMRGKSIRSAREKKQPAHAAHSYEPAPDEILTVTLNKPTADTKLGITLAGKERPYIKSLIAAGLTAKAGLQEHDVFLKVNGQPAVGHEKTTAQLRTATGEILIEFYRVQIQEEV